MITLIDNSGTLVESVKGSLSTYADHALRVLEKIKEHVTIVVSDDKTLQELNGKFTGNNYPTDVLSFNADHLDPETGNFYLGDVIISIDRAKNQSIENNISLLDELTILTIHGILHLCGYDHIDEPSHKKMFAIQQNIIDKLKEQKFERH